MMHILREYSFWLKEIIIPFLTVFMVFFSIWIGWRKGLFSFKLKEKNKEGNQTQSVINSDRNIINITPSEMQKLAYDPDKFNEYHQQSISQCRISFWFSLIFAAFGFLIITTSVFTYTDKSGYIGIVAGAIIDAVSALFFVQSNKARQLMSEFFDRLRQDRKLEEALKLCESVDDTFFRNALKVKLSLFFSGLEDSYNIASEIIRLGRDGSDADLSVTQQESSMKQDGVK
jgi:hypothetical protein